MANRKVPRSTFNPIRFLGRNGTTTAEETSRLEDLIKDAFDSLAEQIRVNFFMLPPGVVPGSPTLPAGTIVLPYTAIPFGSAANVMTSDVNKIRLSNDFSQLLIGQATAAGFPPYAFAASPRSGMDDVGDGFLTFYSLGSRAIRLRSDFGTQLLFDALSVGVQNAVYPVMRRNLDVDGTSAILQLDNNTFADRVIWRVRRDTGATTYQGDSFWRLPDGTFVASAGTSVGTLRPWELQSLTATVTALAGAGGFVKATTTGLLYVDSSSGAGMPGADGEDGEPGPPGRDGAPGAAGAPGRDGAPGPAGFDGEDGADGQPGRDGRDGRDGAPGRDGADGEDGDRGAPGPIGPPGRDGAMILLPGADEDQLEAPWVPPPPAAGDDSVGWHFYINETGAPTGWPIGGLVPSSQTAITFLPGQLGYVPHPTKIYRHGALTVNVRTNGLVGGETYTVQATNSTLGAIGTITVTAGASGVLTTSFSIASVSPAEYYSILVSGNGNSRTIEYTAVLRLFER